MENNMVERCFQWRGKQSAGGQSHQYDGIKPHAGLGRGRRLKADPSGRSSWIPMLPLSTAANALGSAMKSSSSRLRSGKLQAVLSPSDP